MIERLAAAAIALAAVAGAAAAEPETDVVEVLRAGPIVLRGSREAVARVEVVVKPGYHVQANPVLDPALVPISLWVKPAAGIHAGVPRYPAAKRMRLKGADEDLVVLDGRFAIELPVRAVGSIAPGERVLAASLRFQACDDAHCLFPRTVAVAIALRVATPAR